LKADLARFTLLLLCLALLPIASSCVQKMATTGHLRPLGDEAAVRTGPRLAPEGTVPQNPGFLGRASPPKLITMKLLETGREQYNISCLPCHGPSGYGNGMIVQRGFLAPPSYHQERLRTAPDQHFFDVITNGYGAMYGYSDRVSESNRWAIVAYIRALQLSQNTHGSELSVEDRKHLAEKSQRPAEPPGDKI
jgi:mono/diheme cytochrome c family protein